MHHWSNVFYDIFDKPYYEQWSFWLSLLNILVLIVTVAETIKLRKEAQQENRLSIRPVLAFLSEDKKYVIFNPSEQIAFNVIFFRSKDERYQILQKGEVIGAFPSREKYKVEWEKLTSLSQSELVSEIKNIKPLIEHLGKKSKKYQAIVYQDAAGNRLYSVFYAEVIEYDQFFESGYFDEI